jgi:outer membrane protein assembly factor BamA
MRRISALVFAVLALHFACAFAEPFKDPQDGRFDASEWLLDQQGFLPVPIVITEPAVGYGGGLALTFFRESIGEKVEEGKKTGYLVPPDVYAVALAATENGTKLGAVGGMFTFLEDRWRYRGGVARVQVNLNFYGAGGPLDTGQKKIAYTLDGWASSQQVLGRLGNSNHFLALRWIYLDLDSRFDLGQPQPSFTPRQLSKKDSGAGPSWEYDSRDNIFTPSRGMISALDTLFYEPGIGSDNTFQIYRAHAFAYLPLGDSFVLGNRLDYNTARGDVPFYQLPYIDLRGIPAARFQDQSAGVAELELRWNVDSRWAAIGFVGAGRAWGLQTAFGTASNEWSKGVGVRYQIARRLGLYVGADVAWGPENTAFYLQVGNAWR